MAEVSQIVVSHQDGRANPAGIPYLYLGSTQGTAISEIRPNTGELAYVADFTTPPDLNLVDLRSPRKMVSPFLRWMNQLLARRGWRRLLFRCTCWGGSP
jgi:hypothetical protein